MIDQWISVNDRLPEAKPGWNHSERVLLWYEGGEHNVNQYGVGYYNYDPPFSRPFNVILGFMPEYNKPTGDANTTTIDWNTLMPVVEKIESECGASVEIRQGYCGIIHHRTREWQTSHMGSKIESTYKAVVQFIQWYTQNKEI